LSWSAIKAVRRIARQEKPAAASATAGSNKIRIVGGYFERFLSERALGPDPVWVDRQPSQPSKKGESCCLSMTFC
jgi:hypothetical protein